MRTRTARLRPALNRVRPGRAHRHGWTADLRGGMHWEDVCRCGTRRWQPDVADELRQQWRAAGLRWPGRRAAGA